MQYAAKPMFSPVAFRFSPIQHQGLFFSPFDPKSLTPNDRAPAYEKP